MPLAPWHQYAHDAVAAGRAEAAVQEKLRPIVLRIKALEKDEANAAQVAALTRKAEALREQLRALPVRVGRYVMLACERHLRDLETGHLRGLHFSERVAGAAVRFDPAHLATAKTKLFRYKQVQCKGSICPVLVSGSTEQIQFAWEVGVGHSTGIGCGALV